MNLNLPKKHCCFLDLQNYACSEKTVLMFSSNPLQDQEPLDSKLFFGHSHSPSHQSSQNNFLSTFRQRQYFLIMKIAAYSAGVASFCSNRKSIAALQQLNYGSLPSLYRQRHSLRTVIWS